MDLEQLFTGKYICLYPNGSVVGRFDSISEEPFVAAEPETVHFFNTLDEALEYKSAHPSKALSAHRVERLEILQEKFSY